MRSDEPLPSSTSGALSDVSGAERRESIIATSDTETPERAEISW